MKKTLSLLAFSFLFLLSSLAAQERTAAKVEKDNFQQLQLSFSTGDLRMESSKWKLETGVRQDFLRLLADGMQPSGLVGAPNLPVWSVLIEVPVCQGYEVALTGVEYDTLSVAMPLEPVQPSYSKSDTGFHPLVMDKGIYQNDAFFAVGPLATVERVGVARDRTLARLQLSPVSYNPVSGKLAVCRKATVTVQYVGADEQASRELFERYYSPMFGVGQGTFNDLFDSQSLAGSGQQKSVRTAAPVRYLIVAHSMFRGQMDQFVNWKRRKGFITDIVYTDNSSVGTTSTSISAYIRSQYTNATAASPAPTYLLIVGDHEQIPAFSAQVTSPSSDHITDLYYASWTSGDHIPDCYMGRFSAQNVSQLTPQIEKTLMYEQYTFADPSFLDRAVMVAGVDGGTSGDYGYTHADPAMDYAITNYVNGSHGFSQVRYFKNNTSIVPTGSNVTVGSSASSNSATVRNYYNQGAGWINYSAHGSATSWGTPNFTTSHAASMTNTQKFGIMIGNCCLTNKFETTTCLGESVLRKGNYCGAVGYIGGSNSTYWNEDFYWAVGVRSGIGPTMSMAYSSSNLGAYDRLFHTHNEAQSGWATSQASIMMLGNMAVESSSSSYKYYYWEIYHLMGDPSLMPYLTQAPAMTLTASSTIMVGTTSMSVTAAPYAYVALTDTLTHTLQASGFANASGHINLTLPSTLGVGGYELAASAQQYRTAFLPVSVVASSGPYPVAVSIAPVSSLNAGTTRTLRIKVANLGSSTATGVTLSLASDNPLVTLSTANVSVGSIPAGDTVTVSSVTVTASSQAPDATSAIVSATTHWTGSSTQSTFSTPLTVNAPAVAMTVTLSSTSLLPGNNMTISVDLVNNGHATLSSSQLTMTTGNAQLTASGTGGNFTLAAGATLHRQFQLHAAATIDSNIFVPVYIHLAGGQTLNDTLQLYIGINSTETFEGGQYQVQGWVQGTYPWTLVSGESHGGTWSARSAANLGNNNTSEMNITFTVTAADSVSFWYKVSSESNYDKFHCILDGSEKMVASGEVAWTRFALPISAGTHLLTFTYTKDVSQDAGSDCAWIDDVALPHGSQTSVAGGGTADPGTFHNLTATFDAAAADTLWTFVGSDLTNTWKIGTAAANGTGRGLYISNDNGTTNAYTITSPASVFVYTTLWLDTGSYSSSFDWRCQGESTYDYLRAALVPDNIMLTSSTSLPTGWSNTALPTGAIALDGGQKLNLSSSWTTKSTEVNITQAGWYRLVFFWRNDNSVGNMPPAGIDNVQFHSNRVYYTLAVTTNHGVTTGSGSYSAGETATAGIYPAAGYTFTGWNDGNTQNPRQVVMNSNRTLTATLTQCSTTVQHDTVTLVEHDTVTLTQHDTVTLTQHDTVTLTQHDTVTLTDTVVVVEYDTIFLHDTLVVHDTVYITGEGIGNIDALALKVYSSQGQLVVEGADGNTVTLYDVTGRVLATKRDEYLPLRFDVPVSGTYMIKAGNHPARKVVVIL